MNAFFHKSIRLAAVIGLAFLATTCTQEAREDILDGYTEGISLNIDTDIFLTPVSLYFRDANPESNVEEIDGLRITVEGPDKGLLYSTDGSRDLEPVFGILEVALDKATAISPDDPLEFTVVAQAPGYIKTVQNIVLYDTTFQFVPVNMVNLNDPPEGVSIEAGTTAADAGGVVEETVFTTPMPAGKEEDASVKLNQGTKVMNADGEELIGDIEVQLVHFDNRTETSLEAFPGGFSVTNALDENGNAMEPFEFITAGFVALDMFVGNDEVTDFSEPVEVEVGINPQTIDPNSGQPVAEGDIIPYWSLDDNTGQWRREGEAVVTKNADGTLSATMEITHLSWWNFDYRVNVCTRNEPVRLFFESFWHTPSITPRFRAELHELQSNFNAPRRPFGRIWVRPYDGEEVYFYNIPKGRTFRLELYYGWWLVYTSQYFTTTCGSTTTIDLNDFFPLDNIEISAEFSGICEGTSGADVVIQPTAIILYRPSQSRRYFSYLGRIESGKFWTDELVENETYDFFVIVGRKRFFFPNTKISSQVIEVEDYRMEIEIVDTEAGERRCDIVVKDFVIPDEYCDLFN